MPLGRRRNLICLISDRRRAFPDAADADALDLLVDVVEAAAASGIDLIQIRERDLSARSLTSLVTRCVRVAGDTAARIVVNDRLDVAMAAGAHGVHLRHDSVAVMRARDVVPRGFVIGRSIHSVQAAQAADAGGGADYLILGTLFETPSKGPSHGRTPLTAVSEAAALTATPILAIGGITVERTEQVARMGAAGVASIGLFLPPAGPPGDFRRFLHSRVAELRRAFDRCGAVP